MTEKNRLTAKEQLGLMALSGAIDMLHGTDMDAIQPRIESTQYGKRDLAMLRRVSAKILENTLMTVPVDALKRHTKQLSRSKVFVGIPKPAFDRDRDLGWFIPQEDIVQLIAGCFDKCLLCNKEGREINECKLRKALHTLPLEEARYSTTGCDVAQQFREWYADGEIHAG